MELTSYLLGKKAGGGGGDVNIQSNKSITITENTTTTVNPDEGYDALQKVNVTTNIQPNLETKSVTITENTTTTITPTVGKDGLSSVEITTNVSGGSGGLDWSAIGYNGTPQAIQDGYNYAKNIYDNWDSSTTSMSSKYNADREITMMPLVDTSNVTNMESCFYGAYGLSVVPLLNTSKVTTMNSTFSDCRALQSVPALNTSSVTTMQNMFKNCYSLRTIPLFDTSSISNSIAFNSMFNNCLKLTDSSLDNLLQMCVNATEYPGTKTLYVMGFMNKTVYSVERMEALPHYQDFINAGWTLGY